MLPGHVILAAIHPSVFACVNCLPSHLQSQVAVRSRTENPPRHMVGELIFSRAKMMVGDLSSKIAGYNIPFVSPLIGQTEISIRTRLPSEGAKLCVLISFSHNERSRMAKHSRPSSLFLRDQNFWRGFRIGVITFIFLETQERS